MMTLIERQWKTLAIAVIEQAFYDINHKENKRLAPEHDVESAVLFLDNSEELEFYADISGKRNDLVRSGYLSQME